MANDENGNGTPWWSNLPKAFASAVPLSSMSLGATFGMVYNNKSLDQVVKQEADNRDREAYEDENLEFLGGDYEEHEGMYPDIVDQTIYQLENPNALMTPWGPTLDDEVIGMVLAENPAIEGLLGLGDEERVAIQGEADNLLDKAGDFIGDLLNQGSEIAMSVGKDVLNVTKGLFDTVAINMATTVDTSLAGQVVQQAAADNGGDSRWGKGGEEYEDLLLMPPGAVLQAGAPETTDDGDKGGLLQTVMDVAQKVFEATGPGTLKDWKDERAAARTADREVSIFTLLDDALIPDPAEDYKATDDEIVPDFFRMMVGGDISTSDVDSFLDRHPEFETERLALWKGLMGAMEIIELHNKINPPAGAPYSLELIDYTPDTLADWAYKMGDLVPPVNYMYPAPAPTTVTTVQVPGAPSVEGPGYAAGKGGDVVKKANFAKVWYEVMATVPLGNHPEVRRRAVQLQDEAELLFWLYHGSTALTAVDQAKIAGQGDFADVEEMYRGFLSHDAPVQAGFQEEELERLSKAGYAHTPDMYRSGGHFVKKLHELNDILARWQRDGFEMEGYTEAEPIVAIFGENDDYSYALLRSLAMLYVTGGHMGYMAQRIQRTMGRNMDYHRTMGKTATDIFAEITSDPVVGQPFSVPSSPQPQYDFSDIAALRADPAYYETVSGIPRTMTPALPPDPLPGTVDSRYIPNWGTSVDSIKIAGSPVEDPKIAGSPVEDPIEDPTMAFPSVNPAYLPASKVSDAERAAYYANREVSKPWDTMPITQDMYLEAMAWLADAPYGADGSYKPYESKVAAGGIPSVDKAKAMMVANPPFDEDQAKRLHDGLPYQTGRWAGGTAYQWSTLSATDKDTIMGGDLWVKGTTQDPAMWEPPEVDPMAGRTTSPAVVAANKAFLALSPEERALVQLSWGAAFVGEKSPEYLKAEAAAQAKKQKEEQDALIKARTLAASSTPLWMRAHNLN